MPSPITSTETKPFALSDAAYHALDEAGYVVIPGALDAAWIETLKLAFETAPTQDEGTQHVELEPRMPGHDAWMRLKEHPVTIAAAKRILGAPFEVRDVHGRNPLP